MISSKLRLVPGLALASLSRSRWASQTLPVASQEQDQQSPAEGEQAAPEQTAPELPIRPRPSTEPAEDWTAAGGAASREPPQDSAGHDCETPQQTMRRPRLRPIMAALPMSRQFNP